MSDTIDPAKIKEFLAVTQTPHKVLAQASEMAASTLSQILGGARPVGARTKNKLQNGLQNVFQDCRPGLAPNVARDAATLFYQLVPGAAIMGPNPSPGSLVPRDAASFVSTGADQQLTAALDADPFHILVVAAPQTGLSTRVAYARQDLAKQGREVIALDFQELLVQSISESTISVADALRAAADLAVARSGGAIEPGNGGTTITKIFDELLDRFADRSLVVVFDGVHFLPATNDGEALAKLLQDLRMLSGRAAEDPHRYARLSTITTLVPISIAHHTIDKSPFTPFQIRLRWWSKDEIDTLAKALGITDDKLASQAWNQFKGQPYLTHDLLTRSKAAGDAAAVLDSMKSLEDAYGRHWNRVTQLVLDEVRGYPKNDREKAVQSLCQMRQTAVQAEPRALLDALVRFEVLRKAEAGVYQWACPFYEHAAGLAWSDEHTWSPLQELP